ncbi:MAG: DUF2459 domain-containing protein [Balneolales bacterium]
MLTGCLGPVTQLYPENPAERPIPVYVVQVGKHAGLVVKTEHLTDNFPEHKYMPDSKLLKIGWGDDKYYPDPDPSFRVLLRAAFLPSGSVLHVVGLDVPVVEYFTGSEVIVLHISEKGMARLTDFIAGYFRLDDNNNPIYHSYGRYGTSAFFKAHGRYYLPKTSNVWTARALRSAGIPITPVYGVTARNVMRQARGIARDDDEYRSCAN